jgi:hypothetical protein
MSVENSKILEAIEKQNKLIQKQLNLQKTSLRVQEDIRALLLLGADARGELKEAEDKNLENKGALINYGAKMDTLRNVCGSIQFAFEELELDDHYRRKEESEEHSLFMGKIESFWRQDFFDQGRKGDIFSMLFYGELTYRDLMRVLHNDHSYPKNTTRCSSRLETEIRKYLRSNRKQEGLFRLFLDEANKERSHYENVFLDEIVET